MIPIGAIASGFLGAGGTARFAWDGLVWRPQGRADAALYAGALTDQELHAKLSPDLATILSLGPHWVEHGTRRFVSVIEED